MKVTSIILVWWIITKFGIEMAEWCPPTQWEFFSGVRGQREPQHRHGGDQEARHQQIVEVVEGPPPDLDGEGDVQVRFGTAVVDDLISLGRNTFKVGNSWEKEIKRLSTFIPMTSHSPLGTKVLMSPPSSESNFKSSWKYSNKKLFNWFFRSFDERNSQRAAINKSWRFFWDQSLTFSSLDWDHL